MSDGETHRIVVTGGAGFIGSAVCRHLVRSGAYEVLNIDKLTYAGNLESLRGINDTSNYQFAQIDICDQAAVAQALMQFKPHSIMHLAAESHVDRSIDGPLAFVETNIVGTVKLLSATLDYWRSLDDDAKMAFRFHHVSTDEVYGDLPFDSGIFTEETPYAPSSPYSASKAASDHFVRAWHETYGLPIVLSNCSNNYGYFHYPEKLIPLVILNALDEKELPIYGMGENVRDWLFVDDHARALEQIVRQGTVGENYNVGGNSERSNLQVVQSICALLDTKKPRPNGKPYRDLITYVTDRPGHDRRYAIDASKIKKALGWEPTVTFEDGLSMTIDWYLSNEWWWRPIRDKHYDGQRLGKSGK